MQGAHTHCYKLDDVGLAVHRAMLHNSQTICAVSVVQCAKLARCGCSFTLTAFRNMGVVCIACWSLLLCVC